MILLLDRNIRLNWRAAGSAYFPGAAPPLLELTEAPEARERPAGAAEDTGAGAVLDLLADCVASGGAAAREER